jgi:hypothetical protein
MYLYKWEQGLKAYFQNQTEEAIRLYIADGTFGERPLEE